MSFGQRSRVLTDKDHAKIVRLYVYDGLTKSVIAIRYGLSHKAVAKILRDANAHKPNRSLEVK